MIRIALTTTDPELTKWINALSSQEFEWFILTDYKDASKKLFDICICTEHSIAEFAKHAVGKYAIVIWDKNVEQAHKVFQHAKDTQAFTVISDKDGKDLEQIFITIYKQFIDAHNATMIEGKTLLVTSFKGGTGKSLIAINLAKQLAALSKQTTLFIDCSGSFRSTAPWMTLTANKSWQTLRSLLSQSNNVQPHHLTTITTETSEGFSIITTPDELTEPLQIEEMIQLIQAAKKIASYVVIDWHTMAQPNDLKMLSAVDQTLIITQPDLATTIATQQGVKVLNELKNQKNYTIVLNGFDTGSQVAQKQVIEKHLGEKIVHVVEQDSEAIMHYQMLGKLLDDPTLVITHNLRHLADEMMKPGK